MPELPEVEAWVRELDPLVSAHPIERAGPAHVVGGTIPVGSLAVRALGTWLGLREMTRPGPADALSTAADDVA
jgi:hypothetical protein